MNRTENRESENVSIELLYRKLENTLSGEEEERVKRWLGVPEHQVYFEQLKKFYRLDERQGISEQELQEAWVGLHQRIGRRSNDRIKWVLRLAAVAAMLVLGLGLWQFLSEPSSSSQREFPVEQIKPGRRHAILELADGQVYDLSDPEKLADKIADRVWVDSVRLDYSQCDTIVSAGLTYNKLVVPRGGEFQLVLSDGTKVWLNAESQLRYPDVFSGNAREIYLEGEAYFEVAKDSLKPFVIQDGIQRITVLGTSFGVTNYQGESQVSTTLIKGRVKVEFPGISSETYVLIPGNQLFYDRESRQIDKRVGDWYEYIAWKDGKYVFNKKRLEDMLNTLSRWYDFQVFYQNPETKEILFSGELKRFDAFTDILHLIEKTSDVGFRVTGKTVLVTK